MTSAVHEWLATLEMNAYLAGIPEPHSIYVDLKKSNPKLPTLIRECSGVRPVMFARYGE